jgi:hypothetical protein
MKACGAGAASMSSAHRPRNVTDILQTDHFHITVSAASRTMEIRRLSKS